jgi:dienelactone hydrolase
MPPSPFSLQSHLDQIYAGRSRRFALTASNLEEYSAWQTAFRAELTRLFGLSDRPLVQSAVEKCQRMDRGTCTEEKFRLDVGEGVQVPLYVLVPKHAPPFKPVLVFHGHDPSAQYCLGHYPDPETARLNRAVDNNYALALAEAGYLVVVVEQRGFGERLTDQVSTDYPRSCRHLAFSYLMHGRTLLGERCWDGLCAVSYLLSRPDVSAGLGCTGQSGGGTTALWLSAIDPRIRVVVVSGYFNSFRGSILSIEHCECNYVPGILELAEMGDIAALIAPRPFCAINGEKDEIFPVATARQQFRTVHQAYALHDAADACRLEIHPGGHAYHNAIAQTWFARWMR